MCGDAPDVLLSPGGFVEYRPSAAWPVVLSAPHGGDLLPEGIPDRKSGCIEPDTLSWELALEVWAAFGASASGPPALIGSHLHRCKLDANRSRDQSCEKDLPGAEAALEAWDAYHGWIEAALRRCVENFGFCFLLDLHGQSHRKGATELGYLLTSEDLLLDDATLDARPPRPTSVDAFVRGAGCRLSSLVRGPDSLGGLLSRQGFPCVPSPEAPQPVSRASLEKAQRPPMHLVCPPTGAAALATYFWGGYSARRYGAPATLESSRNPLSAEAVEGWASCVAAVQLETGFAGLRDEEDSRKHFGAALRAAVEGLLRAWRGWLPS